MKKGEGRNKEMLEGMPGGLKLKEKGGGRRGIANFERKAGERQGGATQELKGNAKNGRMVTTRGSGKLAAKNNSLENKGAAFKRPGGKKGGLRQKTEEEKGEKSKLNPPIKQAHQEEQAGGAP